MSCYSFEDRGTGRQTDGIDFGMYSQMIYDTPIKAENYIIVVDDENNIPLPLLH